MSAATLCAVAAAAVTLALGYVSPAAAYAGFVHGPRGCHGRNELGAVTASPQTCYDTCRSNVSCVSFEVSDTGLCHMSTTCTLFNADGLTTGWDGWFRAVADDDDDVAGNDTPQPPQEDAIVPSGKIFITDYGHLNHRVSQFDLSGDTRIDLRSGGLTLPVGLAVDFDRGYIYVSDYTDGFVARMDLDGTDLVTLVSGLVHPYGIAHDDASQTLYFAVFGAHAILRVGTTGVGASPSVAVSGITTPLALALDVPNGHIYWTDQATLSVGRADLSTGDNKLVLWTSVGGGDMQGIALDSSSNHIYVTLRHTVERFDMSDGSNHATLVTGLEYARGVALDLVSSHMYFTDIGASTVIRADFDGTNRQEIAHIANGGPQHIVVLRCDGTSTHQCVNAGDVTVSYGPYESDGSSECTASSLLSDWSRGAASRADCGWPACSELQVDSASRQATRVRGASAVGTFVMGVNLITALANLALMIADASGSSSVSAGASGSSLTTAGSTRLDVVASALPSAMSGAGLSSGLMSGWLHASVPARTLDFRDFEGFEFSYTLSYRHSGGFNVPCSETGDGEPTAVHVVGKYVHAATLTVTATVPESAHMTCRVDWQDPANAGTATSIVAMLPGMLTCEGRDDDWRHISASDSFVIFGDGRVEVMSGAASAWSSLPVWLTAVATCTVALVIGQ